MIFKVKLVYLHFTLLLNYSKSFRLFCGNKNNFYPPWWDPPASSLTHYQMSSGLCIILFILSFLDFFFRAFSQGFITHVLGEGFHTLIKSVLFSSITNVGHHNPPPIETQCPRWHSFLSRFDVRPPPNPSPLGPASLLTYRLVSSFYTICNNPDASLVDRLDV